MKAVKAASLLQLRCDVATKGCEHRQKWFTNANSEINCISRHLRKGIRAPRNAHVTRSLDDMAEREMAKRKQQNKFSTSQKEFEDLVKAIPDPAREQDGLLADDSLFYDSGTWGSYSSESDDDFRGRQSRGDPMQSWDGVDGSLSLFDDTALSSLPFGDVEAEEAAAAASEGVPTYRGSSGSDQGNARGLGASLPTARSFKKPGTQTPEEAALEEFLMTRAVDQGMELHHARLEAAHNRYSVASAFGELLQDIEQDDVWRNAEPLLPGTDVRIPTWIRASEAMLPLMEELNAKTIEFEEEHSEAAIQESEEQILEEVESARRLLSLTDPKAGLSIDTGAIEMDALDAFFGDEDTLLPGTADILEGEDGESLRLTAGKENSVMNSLLEEILPEISGYALDYADLAGDGTGGPGMLSGALQALTDEVDTVLEEDGPMKSTDEESDGSDDNNDDIE